jgi:NADPH:quinone reductase-like Zn-dependent oxidoreductase
MRAIVARRYGGPDVLELREVDRPAPGDGEVLVEVHAAAVNPYDWHHLTGTPYIVRPGAGLRAPRHPVPGMDWAGRVAAVGRGGSRFRPGDEVYGMSRGAFAEYLCAPADALAAKPANLTFAEAAAVPMAGLTALQALRRGRLRPGHRVLVNGGSGGVGTFAVQLARALGAEVTAVCGTRNVEQARALGAAHVVDYTREDLLARLAALGGPYDVVLDLVGNHSLADRRRALRPDGTLVLVGGPKDNRWTGPLGALLAATAAGPFLRRRMVGMLATVRRADLDALRDLHEAGSVRPVVERAYPLHRVPEALARLAAGHTRGKLVVTVRANSGTSA